MKKLFFIGLVLSMAPLAGMEKSTTTDIDPQIKTYMAENKGFAYLIHALENNESLKRNPALYGIVAMHVATACPYDNSIPGFLEIIKQHNDTKLKEKIISICSQRSNFIQTKQKQKLQKKQQQRAFAQVPNTQEQLEEDANLAQRLHLAEQYEQYAEMHRHNSPQSYFKKCTNFLWNHKKLIGLSLTTTFCFGYLYYQFCHKK